MSATITESPKPPIVPGGDVPTPAMSAARREDSGLIPIFTLVLWVGCLTIGFVGFVLPYLRPQPAPKTPPPVVAELLNVELTSDPLPPPNPARPPRSPQPPPLARPAVVPPAPPMMALAEPSPQIAFAVPIEAPARIVPAKEASFRTVESTPIVMPTPEPPAPQPLTFGRGEGRQPAPEYPRQALREGQEGVVTVRMTVREDGRVLAAEASSPSPWPLLNDAAVRVVKSRWRFAPGAVRAYEVAIRFQLNR